MYGSFNQVSSMTRRISINEMTLHLCEVQGAGADEVRVESTGNYTTSLKRFARILNTKSETCGAQCGVGITALDHICSRIHELCEGSLRQNLFLTDSPAPVPLNPFQPADAFPLPNFDGDWE